MTVASFLAALLGAPPGLAGEEPVPGFALVERAAALHTLRSEPGAGLRLRVHVKLLGLVTGDKEGEYLLVQESPERFFTQMRFPGFTELGGVSGAVRWRKRNTVDKPFRMHQMSRALELTSHLRVAPGARVSKSWQTTQGRIAADCITIAPSPDLWQRERAGQAALAPVELDKDSKVSLCFDQGTGALVKVDYGAPLPRFEYEGALHLGESVFPKVLRCFEGGDLAVEAVVEELVPTPKAAGDDAFAPPAGADKWPACSAPVPPRLLEKKLVREATFTKARRIFGTVIFFAEVGADGIIRDMTGIGVRHGELYLHAWKAAESQRYQPATCDGTPVPCELYLAYRFAP